MLYRPNILVLDKTPLVQGIPTIWHNTLQHEPSTVAPAAIAADLIKLTTIAAVEGAGAAAVEGVVEEVGSLGSKPEAAVAVEGGAAGEKCAAEKPFHLEHVRALVVAVRLGPSRWN